MFLKGTKNEHGKKKYRIKQAWTPDQTKISGANVMPLSIGMWKDCYSTPILEITDYGHPMKA